ncbi:hypothetical protein VTJ49DRAFT_3384 [Mycothermus thermophilus]|uniref:ATP-dependent DNA helicase CHL1 n=1 Tax=Humicola insolens TaxID=85995 RepID=A0ABR3V8A4_HUMIN
MDKVNQSTIDDIPPNFHHPYQPYHVQLEFMRTVYDILEKGNGQVGILESPTGTGKSLSLLCASLTWLRSHARQRFTSTHDTLAAQMSAAGEPEWMVNAALRKHREELVRRWEEREKALERARRREREMEERAARDSERRRGKRVKGDGEDGGKGSRLGELEEEREFLVRDWEEDEEGDGLRGLSRETRELMMRVGMGGGKREEDGNDKGEEEETVKIYYTSRTHSQLTQFISELRRPTFPPSVPPDLLSRTHDQPSSETIKEVPLSSRQKLCINPSVSRLGSLSAINDRCTELQQSKSKDRCPYMPTAENLKQTHEFRDAALATIPDIEDLHRIGKELQVCPYYASRTAIPAAEIVTLPYQLLLQKSAREALGIKLEGNVVIIDEAHNVMDAIANVHAAEIRLSELKRARGMLGVYVKRFGKKLKGANRVMVAQVGRVVESLSECLMGFLGGKTDQGILESSTLLKARGADQINLYQLINYIQESKLAYKVESYASHIEEQQDPSTTSTSRPSCSPVLHTLVSFLTALTNLTTEGRIFYEKLPSTTPNTPPDIKLSYLLLSPTHAFSSIASSARAIILAGGTMSPFDDYKTHLFPTHSPAKITTLSCGHVIPRENLFGWVLASVKPTPQGGQVSTGVVQDGMFEFSFQKRNDPSMIRQLGLVLLNICSVVPDGVVVFFPSYKYLEDVVQAWQGKDAEPQPQSIWERLSGKKAVLCEERGGDTDELLRGYSEAILSPTTGPGTTRKPGGALLLSVVGGKLSEGINFADRLGRCVVVVGLPYPNAHSPEWKARLEYVEAAVLEGLERERQQNPVAGGGGETASAGAAAPSSDSQDLGQGADGQQPCQSQVVGSATAPPAQAQARAQPDAQARAQARQAAQAFYENACMRAVNQSIGRAIRHRGDYAAVVLIDRRYASPRVREKLPGWIRAGIVEGSEHKGLQGLMGGLRGFFKGRE